MDPQRWITYFLSPTPQAIFFTLVLALSIPLLVHYILYRSAAATTLPSFLLLGPSDAGKTSLLTFFERGQCPPTHTSQAPLTVELSLPASSIASSKFRSTNDPSSQAHRKLLLLDTPGHGKLRYHALELLNNTQNLNGVIFMVDAASISTNDGLQNNDGLRDAAEYLYEVLLLLKRKPTKASRAAKELPFLIAANKFDLFSALPAPLVKTALESEITKIRSSRARGLQDSSVDDVALDEERDWLGESKDAPFNFKHLEDVNVFVSVIGGSVLGTEKSDVAKWRDWIGNCL